MWKRSIQCWKRPLWNARCFSGTSYVARIKSGQAIHENRPHLVHRGDLTPGITAEEYYVRRMNILQSLPDNSAMIVSGNVTQMATTAVFHEFRQDPSFYYLTGFLEPNAVLVMYRENADKMHSVFFVQEADKMAELWDGERAGTMGAVEIFNADRAYPIYRLEEQVAKLASEAKIIYTDAWEPRFPESVRKMFSHFKGVQCLPATPIIEQGRIIKSEQEIDCMRAASEISAIGFNRAMSRQFESESELHAYLDYQFRIGGCEMPAYLPVVAGGSHALTIHYTRNDDLLRDGDLVLVDAGGRFGGYSADISRTWPVNGKFTAPQRDLYQAVLNVEKECIKMCTSQGAAFDDLHRKSEDLLYSELLNAGFTTLTRGKIRELYPHYIGHHLGLDVHDIKNAGRFDKFQTGQVITVEPGVYVPDNESWPKHFRGIGIRIEDNVVIGPHEPEVLTVDTVKEIEDIEALRMSK